MDTNPLSSPDTSDDDAPAAAGVPAALASAPPASALPAPSLAPGAFPSTVLQTLDIRHHVPVTLDLHAGNYAQWSRFFLTIVGMFGVRDHLVAPAAPRRRDPEWVMVDHCVVHWLYATISPELLDAVMQPEDTAEVLWAAIESIFRDNNLSRAVYLDAEYHAVVQGDLTVMQYCTRLKTFADQLRDLGQPVSERQQLFNMLRGLGRQYHNAIPHLTSRVPLPTFLEARSFLLLEEHRAEQAVRQQSAHALIAARPPAGSPPPSPQSDGSAGRGRGRNRRRGRGNGGPPGHPPRLHLRLSWSELQHRASSATAAVGHGRPSDRASGRAHFLAVSHQHLGLVHGLRRLLAHDIKPRISAPAW